MATETFRQERTPQQNQASLESIQAVQKAAGQQVPMTGGPQIMGNIPPQIQDILSGGQGGPVLANNIAEVQAVQGMMQNSKLQELINGARKFTQKYEAITLPSLGRFYNGVDGPQNGILHVRGLTGEEENLLANPRLTRKGGDWLRGVFSNCIQEKYDTDNFLQEDRHYLLIFLRGISFGPDYEAEITCSTCNEKFPTTVDLDQDIQLTYCPEDFTSENLKGTLPTTGYNFAYRFPKVSDDITVSSHKSKGLQTFGSGFNSDEITYKLSLFITDVEGVQDQRSISALLKQLPANDLNYVRDLIYDTPFGVRTELNITCPLCTSENITSMPLGISFFWPRADRRKKQA